MTTEPTADAEPTRRVVLKRERVLVLPEGIPASAVAAAGKALGLTGIHSPAKVVDAWVVVAEHESPSKRGAIITHTGEPNTPDAKPGDFKAVPVRSWKGGIRLSAPPRPLYTAEALED